jgi:hypothetical protein
MPANKGLKLTKPSIMELRSLTLCSADQSECHRTAIAGRSPS